MSKFQLTMEVDYEVIFFKGTAYDGTDFCGTADDLNTALDMAIECIEGEQ